MNDQPPRKLLLLLVVLAVGSLTFGVNAATPALAAIARAFPDVSPRLIKMVITIPQLFIMPATLICGALSRSISKKKLLLIGMLLFAIGGLMPAFYGGIIFILVIATTVAFFLTVAGIEFVKSERESGNTTQKRS